MKKLGFLSVVVLVACGSSGGHYGGGGNFSTDLARGGGGTPDFSTGGRPDLAMSTTCCARPGDRGNELGVGRYCTKTADCADTAEQTICLADGTPVPRLTFCTKQCASPGDPVCGDNATCECSALPVCVCYPTLCLPLPNYCKER